MQAAICAGCSTLGDYRLLVTCPLVGEGVEDVVERELERQAGRREAFPHRTRASHGQSGASSVAQSARSRKRREAGSGVS
jgi:hypothetical protein